MNCDNSDLKKTKKKQTEIVNIEEYWLATKTIRFEDCKKFTCNYGTKRLEMQLNAHGLACVIVWNLHRKSRKQDKLLTSWSRECV